ncbi:MAG TPA: efflux RND transporter periplasmic adaptor subunit [Gemmataceae bacterium]
MQKEQSHEEQHKIVVTSPQAKYVTITQRYVCQIHSQRNINVRALVDGYLQQISVKEGQAVKARDVMFRILPTLYEAEYDAERAEAQLARIELENAERLLKKRVVSDQDVRLHRAKLQKAEAKVELAKARYNFTVIRAPFDGIVDRLREREGSLIKERDILTTVSDNSVMWVYFNVPEGDYLAYMASLGKNEDPRIELVLANGNKFPKLGKIGAIEAEFNNKTGTVPFRADFENEFVLVNGSKLPRLRHGQTGSVLIHRTLNNALVIPQRAVFEILDKRYVYVLGEDDVMHQRLITIEHELEDIFVLKSGLDVKDKIVLEGVRQVHDGDTVEEFEFRMPEEALAHQKSHAE